MLSIIIPTFQEEKSIKNTLKVINEGLTKEMFEFEIIVVDDNSYDQTKKIISNFSKINPNIHFYLNDSSKGFGNSIVKGIEYSKGIYVAIMMADLSDSVDDLINYYNTILNNKKLDCVFGDRWSENSVKNYPFFKKVVNRTGNIILMKLFKTNYSDFTNSFKLYKRSALKEISPIISNHFSITLELPLKMIARGYNYKVVSNKWENREHGVSKMQIFNSIVTYSLITVYCLIDKYFWNKRLVIKR